MYLEIYLDVLFLVNFCMDYIILGLLKIILKQKSSKLRLVAASIAGSLAACLIALFPNLNGFMKFILMYIAVSFLMIKITLNCKGIKKMLKVEILLFFLTFVMGGMLNTIYYYTDFGYYFITGFPFLIICGLLCAVIIKSSLWILKWVKGQTENFYPTEIIFEGKKISGIGLLDTGNSLREPVSRKPVVIIEYDILKNIFTEQFNYYIMQYYHPSVKPEAITIPDHIAVKLKYIPYHCVGIENGMLIGIICPQLNIQREQNEWIQKQNVCVAIYEGTLSENHNYNMILHEELL